MNKLIKILALVAMLALSACASTVPTKSFVAPEITAGDAETLAADAVKQLADPLPPAQTTLVLDPPEAANDALTTAMTQKLSEEGYGVVQVDQKTGKHDGKGVALRYLASPMFGGVVLRLQYRGSEAAKYYPRGKNGRLLTTAPFTVREGAGHE